MDIILHTGYVILVLFSIVFACIIFTNAVEHLGEELNLSEGAVGSVLAAVGTALPETIVPMVAIIGAYVGWKIANSEENLGYKKIGEFKKFPIVTALSI